MKKLFVLLLAIFTFTGCVKYEGSLNIEENGDTDFRVLYALDTSYFSEDDVFSEEELQEYIDEGYTVEEYEEDGMTGFILTKELGNINNISSSEDVVVNLSGDEVPSDFFTVEKGFLKNTYTAKLTFDASTDETEDEEDYEDDSDMDFDFDTDQMTDMFTNSMSLTFQVNLPNEPISTNADEVVNGTVLNWDLSMEEEQTIEFKFELQNRTNLYIIIAIAILVIGTIVFTITKKQRKA